jgi:hypothetical protein
MTVSYPDAVKRALKQKRTTPKKPPKLTAIEPQIIEYGRILIQVLVLVAMGAIASGIGNTFLACLIAFFTVFGGAITILQVRWQWYTYPRRYTSYQAKVTSHLRALEAYGNIEALSDGNSLVNLLSQYEFVYEAVPISTPSNLAIFNNLLRERMGEKIYRCVSVPLENSIVQLDWAYIDSSLNLHVAILIYDSSLAYFSSQQILLKTGWIVVEFGENELIDLPEKSVETILQTINNLVII